MTLQPGGDNICCRRPVATRCGPIPSSSGTRFQGTACPQHDAPALVIVETLAQVMQQERRTLHADQVGEP